MNLEDILARVQRLRWRLSKPVTSFLVGPYRSTFKGEGIEFADARPYERGDDLRRIHWSLSARKNQPYIWLGQEERELSCVIAIDRSASMRISPLKEQMTLEAAVAMGLSAMLNGDKVRWVSFTDRIEFFSPAKRGERHIWGSLAHLLAQKPKSRKTCLSPLLSWFAMLHKRRALLVIISDLFLQDEGEIWRLVEALAIKHFVCLIRPLTPEEALDLPWGMLPIQEVETGIRATAKGGLSLPLLPITRLRIASLTSESDILLTLRQALLPPLH
ncbi:MAG: DUF58 domain-containing protein [Bacteroidia bacterium]|nr:DUF58 domain-containing protein [Bacteroidia bacterium]MDW8134767.1 DUF58 domain-containing protein [Bacteroidia bacterium]